jgi:hypothetical protein
MLLRAANMVIGPEMTADADGLTGHFRFGRLRFGRRRRRRSWEKLTLDVHRNFNLS